MNDFLAVLNNGPLACAEYIMLFKELYMNNSMYQSMLFTINKMKLNNFAKTRVQYIVLYIVSNIWYSRMLLSDHSRNQAIISTCSY